MASKICTLLVLWAVIDKSMWLSYTFIVQLVEPLALNYIYGSHVAGLRLTDAFYRDEHISSMMQNVVREIKIIFPELLNIFYTCCFFVCHVTCICCLLLH